LLIKGPDRKSQQRDFTADDKRRMLGKIALDRIASNDPLRDQEKFSSEDVFGATRKVLGESIDCNKLLDEIVEINGINQSM
jgi:hypothetical protein